MNRKADLERGASPPVPDEPFRNADQPFSKPAGEADEVIELVEETARIEKRTVEKGRVRVDTRTDMVEQVIRETLRGEVVGVTRVPVDRVINEGDVAPQMRTEGEITIIPVLEEILVVEKKLVLKEEVHIRRTQTGKDVEIPVTLRKQRATVERLGPDDSALNTPADSQSKEPER